MDGLIKCSIVPREREFVSAGPNFRCNTKLMFCLCRSRVLPSASGECKHSKDEERALTGTWVMDEVRLEVEKGYKIREIYEIYEYRLTKFRPKPLLFLDFKNTFLKLESETRGYPGWVRSLADEERYIEWYAKSKGIRLNKGLSSLTQRSDVGVNCASSPCGENRPRGKTGRRLM